MGKDGSRIDLLKEVICGYRKFILAFSGGKDSTLVLKVGIDVLGRDNIIAVTARSPIRKREELERAEEIARLLQARHMFVYTKEHEHPEFAIVEQQRQCMVCKEILFHHLKGVADQSGFPNLVDGTNYDDWQEERPVFKIREKFDVRGPLVEARITSKEVSSILKAYNLPNWSQPHYSCSKDEIDLSELILF